MAEGEGDIGSSSSSGGTGNESCPPQNILILLESEEFMEYLLPHARNYQELNPHITLELQQVDKKSTAAAAADGEGSEAAVALQELILEKENVDDIRWDGAIFPSQNIGTFMEAGVLWDMSKFILQEQQQQPPGSLLEWEEILPFFRYQMARFDDNQIPMIPLDGDVLTMYYRKDLFEQYNIQIPRTWEEYTKAAQFFHGKSLGSHGSLLFGSCISFAPTCANGYWTSLILSSMTQSTGTSDGFFFDPQTLGPLFGPALDRTLEILAQQLQFGHSEKLTGQCLEANYAFNEGKCALTYNWGSQMTRYPMDSRVGDIGVAPTPGSTSILDRASNTLQTCTEDTCPYGIYYDDIGIVNHAPYSAFGGWAAGISNSSSTERQHATMDFFSYVSNSQQSLPDVLPNGRSYFAQPYRYSHVTSSNWIQQAGTEPELAYQYTSSIRDMSVSGNAVQELRMPLSSTFRQIVDEEITYYLDQLQNNSSNVGGDASELRKEVTTRLDQRIRDVITTTEQQTDIDLLQSYQQSIGYNDTAPGDTDNLIDEDYRNAAWGLSALMCFIFLGVMIWIIRERNNRVMKAFQPFLLMQSAIGLFLLAATIIPLGLDDSLVSVDVLDVTCMAIPWVYITGFTIFFSSVYVKIRKCVQIYHEPKKNDALVVSAKSSIHLTIRLMCLNGAIMTVWTIVDPLKWTRTDVEGGIVLEDGTVETYGICMGSSWASLLMALILLFLNLIITCIATFQAFSCRFLVLEYNEMQWLPLSTFPFVEVWLIGAPIIALTYDDPTILFVVLSMMIAASTICAGLSVFAQKDWYIRKDRYAQRGRKKGLPDEVSSPRILVLKHPTLESQKQLEQVQNQFEQIHAYNTELEVEIRILKDKFKKLTASQKYAVTQGLFGVASSTIDSREDRTTNAFAAFDQTGATKANDAELEAMEQFERVWKMPDEDFEDENLEASHGQLSSTAMPNGLDSMSTVDPDGHATAKRGKDGAAMESAARGVTFSQDCSTTRETSTLSANGALLASPDSKGVSVYEDQESKEASTEDPSRIEWFLNSCDSSEEDSEEDPEKIMEITNRAIAMAAINGDGDREGEEKPNQARMVATKRAPSPSQLYKHEANVEVDPMQEDFGNEPMQDDFGSESEQDWSESESSDVVFKRKDEKELKSMIKYDDLDALEEKANLLAQSLKTKLMNNSQLANLSTESEPKWNLGKERASAPKGLNDLDISKITQDDLDTTRSFVVMSDSILAESPARNGVGNGYHPPASMLGSSPSRSGGAGRGSRGENQRIPPQSIYYTNDGDSRSSGRRHHPAGESSAANYAIHGGNESPSSSSPTGSLTQNPGEPSEGDRPKANSSIFRENDKSFPEAHGEVGFDLRGQKSQSKKLPPPKTLQFKTDEPLDRDRKDSSSVNKSFSISDWSAVGNTASLLQDWSDSHSTSSYAESSYAESCSSLEATTRASALDTPLANEIDKLVSNLDWEGVKHAATKYEKSAAEDQRNLSIQEKRRKKRELEAWRTSISRSFSKEPDN